MEIDHGYNFLILMAHMVTFLKYGIFTYLIYKIPPIRKFFENL